MSCGGGEEKQWSCGQAGAVNLQRVTSIVRDMGEPCLSQSPVKVVITVNRMLKPDKWQATFDGDGKVSGFQKALKSIVLGGVDPSIRPEVWEFLLGCYALGSTAEYRRQLRMARRERYKDLIKQCQTMHSSIGTGALAYVVGSKVMDVRTSSKDDRVVEAEVKSRQASIDNTNRIDNYTSWNTNCTDTCFEGEGESSCDSAELVSVRESTDSPLYDSSWFLPISSPCNGSSSKNEEEACGSQYAEDSFFDFPPLPVTDLFAKSGEDEKECCMHDNKPSTCRKLRFGDDAIHSFEVNNNVKLVMESSGSQHNGVSRHDESELELISHNDHAPEFCHDFDVEAGHSDGHVPISSIKLSYEKEIANRLRISVAPETPLLNATTSQGGASEDRVSEWLWTLHRIVVDVVRTDSHLEFYEDKRNLARMSDILAVYAWVDPATGYCQGMSDLLSPFVVLFEDNADAFWCFEMLLRRMHDNFQMEGPTGVMKQLQALWHVLELTDREMFYHLSRIGAESLHFAFRMLMVLFRRELSFSDALRMWEMMWAVDFDESVACDLEENCLEALMLDLPKDSVGDVGEESTENGDASSKDGSHGRNGNAEHSTSDNNGIKPASAHHFCGLTRNFWSRSECMPISPIVSSTKNGNDELPVFCVAAILIMNRHKIIRETQSIDDMIKIFNDKLLKIHVRRCIRSAIKLRKKYFYKLIRSKSPAAQIGD